MRPLEKVLKYLDGVEERGNGWWALCPVHDDHDPSLHVEEKESGHVVYICRAGCDQHRVTAALEERGLKKRDLFPKGSVVSTEGHSKQRESLTATYYIKDANGHLRGIHERLEGPTDKRFLWKHPNGHYSKRGEIKPSKLPLFNSEHVADWPQEYGIVLTEGEKPAAALISRNIRAVGTVTGSSGTPGAEALETLRDRKVILWPDNDEAGRAHMQRIAEALDGVAGSVQWYAWGRKEKDDAADHPAVRSGDRAAIKELAYELKAAPQWERDKQEDAATEGRILLGRVIVHGIEPPEELVPDVLLCGKVHSIYSGASTGKTFLMLWLILRVLEQGKPVLVFDMENGPRIMAERLEQLGADPDVLDKLLHYHFYPSLPTTEEGLLDYEMRLDAIRPAAVVFDSWINFLAANGMEENSSNDIATWAAHYTHPARSRAIAVLLLDHVPKDGVSSRGSGRKKDEVDVMWALRNPASFDRDTVGHITLTREKDREGWLPESVRFSVGGGESGFIFSRSEGTIEEEDSEGLKPSERKALEVLEGFGEKGAKAAEWQKAAARAGVPRTTFYRHKPELIRKNWVLQENSQFFVDGTSGTKEVPRDQMEPGPEKVPPVPPPFRVVVPDGTGAIPGSTEYQEETKEDLNDLAELEDLYCREGEQ